MQAQALVLEAHHTTHIEGTHLTLDQSKQLLAGERLAGIDPDDERELLNYRNASELVSDYLGSGEPITEGLIREIHKRLVRGVRGETATPGEYRHVQNYIVNSITREVIYTPPPTIKVPRLMADLAGVAAGRKRDTSGSGGGDRAIRVSGHPSVSRWKRENGTFAFDVMFVSDGLRFQAFVHDQRVLRPEPAGVLPGVAGHPGAEFRSDRLAGILHGGARSPIKRGTGPGGRIDPSGRARVALRAF